MVLQAPLDSVSVWSHPVALRTLPQRQAIAERRSGSELPIDSQDRELLRFSHSIDEAVNVALARMPAGLLPPPSPTPTSTGQSISPSRQASRRSFWPRRSASGRG